MAKEAGSSFGPAGAVRLCVALLGIGTLASSGLAQVPRPDSRAYDAPPVLIRQDLQSIHQQLLQSAPATGQENESGVAVLSMAVDTHGLPSHVRVIRGVGMDLDQKAVETAGRDRFQPALKDGEPVRATIYVKVTFDHAANSGQ